MGGNNVTVEGERAHHTDGTQCWCNPIVESVDVESAPVRMMSHLATYRFSDEDRAFIALCLDGWASEWDGTTRAEEGDRARRTAELIRGGQLFLRSE